MQAVHQAPALAKLPHQVHSRNLQHRRLDSPANPRCSELLLLLGSPPLGKVALEATQGRPPPRAPLANLLLAVLLDSQRLAAQDSDSRRLASHHSQPLLLVSLPSPHLRSACLLNPCLALGNPPLVHPALVRMLRKIHWRQHRQHRGLARGAQHLGNHRSLHPHSGNPANPHRHSVNPTSLHPRLANLHNLRRCLVNLRSQHQPLVNRRSRHRHLGNPANPHQHLDSRRSLRRHSGNPPSLLPLVSPPSRLPHLADPLPLVSLAHLLDNHPNQRRHSGRLLRSVKLQILQVPLDSQAHRRLRSGSSLLKCSPMTRQWRQCHQPDRVPSRERIRSGQRPLNLQRSLRHRNQSSTPPRHHTH